MIQIILTFYRLTLCHAFDPLLFDPLSFDSLSVNPIFKANYLFRYFYLKFSQFLCNSLCKLISFSGNCLLFRAL